MSDKFTESFDLILSRHTMIHLYNADVLKVIKNFKDSGSKYIQFEKSFRNENC